MQFELLSEDLISKNMSDEVNDVDGAVVPVVPAEEVEVTEGAEPMPAEGAVEASGEEEQAE